MSDRDLILAAESERRRAVVAVDLAALDQLFADDMIHVHSNAMVHDKAGVLAHIETNRAFTGVERGELDIRIDGDHAIMAGRLTNHMQLPSGPLTFSGFVIQTLRREAGAWRFTSFQMTRDPA